MPDAAELLTRIVGIIVIDLVLSGDNAIVIGMAAQPLPPRQRRLAVIVGGAGAFVLRTLLTVVAVALLAVPAIKLVGGALLLWIAYKLLETDQQQSGRARRGTSLWGAIGTILLADLIMSLDNVLGVAAASNGNYLLLALGLAVAMAIVLLGGGLFAELIDRLSWLPYLGAAVIAWTGTELLQDDPLLATSDVGLPLRVALDLLVTLGVLALAYCVHRAHHRPVAPPQRTAE